MSKDKNNKKIWNRPDLTRKPGIKMWKDYFLFLKIIFESSGPTSLFKQDHPRAHSTEFCPDFLNVYNEGESKPFWGICSSTWSLTENCYTLILVELPVQQFLPIATCPIAHHHWEDPGFMLLTPSLLILTYIDDVPS